MVKKILVEKFYSFLIVFFPKQLLLNLFTHQQNILNA